MIRRVHHHKQKLDRNFRNDSGVYEWAKLQAERKRHGLDAPILFFAVFYDREYLPYSAGRVLSGDPLYWRLH